MSAEDTLNRARAVVVNSEAQFKMDHLALGKALVNVNLDESEKELRIVHDEDERVKDPGYDEEEFRLGNLAKRKKK